MVKQKEDIFMTEEGFFFGHMLKDGKLAKGARRITEDEIMTMFARFFEVYCAQQNTDHIVIEGNDGFRLFAKELKTELGKVNN